MKEHNKEFISSSKKTKPVDTIDIISDVLGEPRMTEKEKAEYIDRAQKRMEQLKKLEEENARWQAFRRVYIEEAEKRAREDWDKLKEEERMSVGEKLHDMLHNETGLEEDRNRTR